ncbi:hypothetical protein TEA_011224 [Camellia sinensis var. sinensis]|uniref:Uncharacterized protein n=1 Tax=Camellia sinensis var. sinensis TaxID=542762 RepID=A0A4S4DQB8_CAMSN|nr:hypothetical protein TEA_011224 [Camellia sinensis var. sinensis]
MEYCFNIGDAYVSDEGNASVSQQENGFVDSLSILNSEKAVQEIIQQPLIPGIEDNLIEFSEAMRTVAKALRRAAEGKASAQAEAAEWKRKFELERARNLQLEQKGLSGPFIYFAMRVFSSADENSPQDECTYVHICATGNKICAKLQNCWARASPDNAMGIIRLFLQCLVCWDIWKEQSGGVSEVFFCFFQTNQWKADGIPKLLKCNRPHAS